MTQTAQTIHGGPDGGPPIAHDFSTNANACGPSPSVRAAVHAAPREAYPDPSYAVLRQRLAAHHGVDAGRIALAAGASEGLRRLSLAWQQAHGAQACVFTPQPGYGDYAAAADALGLPQATWHSTDGLCERLDKLSRQARPLVWTTEPHSPTGASLALADWQRLARLIDRCGGLLAIDRAYEPLRLQGHDPVPADIAEQAWQAWSPNKACGLTGVRAAYATAPSTAHAGVRERFERLAASWVLGADGVAMLTAACAPLHLDWLAAQRPVLREWEGQQRALLCAWGWRLRPSVANFLLAHPGLDDEALAAFHRVARQHGIKLRDGASFGLAGWLRLGVRSPASQAALAEAWQAFAARQDAGMARDQSPRGAAR